MSRIFSGAARTTRHLLKLCVNTPSISHAVKRGDILLSFGIPAHAKSPYVNRLNPGINLQSHQRAEHLSVSQNCITSLYFLVVSPPPRNAWHHRVCLLASSFQKMSKILVAVFIPLSHEIRRTFTSPSRIAHLTCYIVRIAHLTCYVAHIAHLTCYVTPSCLPFSCRSLPKYITTLWYLLVPPFRKCGAASCVSSHNARCILCVSFSYRRLTNALHVHAASLHDAVSQNTSNLFVAFFSLPSHKMSLHLRVGIPTAWLPLPCTTVTQNLFWSSCFQHLPPTIKMPHVFALADRLLVPQFEWRTDSSHRAVSIDGPPFPLEQPSLLRSRASCATCPAQRFPEPPKNEMFGDQDVLYIKKKKCFVFARRCHHNFGGHYNCRYS
jgi:hypothetical protein